MKKKQKGLKNKMSTIQGKVKWFNGKKVMDLSKEMTKKKMHSCMLQQ